MKSNDIDFTEDTFKDQISKLKELTTISRTHNEMSMTELEHKLHELKNVAETEPYTYPSVKDYLKKKHFKD